MTNLFETVPVKMSHLSTKLKKTYKGVEPCRDKSRDNIKYAKREAEGETLMLRGQTVYKRFWSPISFMFILSNFGSKSDKEEHRKPPTTGEFRPK